MIVLFTDFGADDLYVGQVKAALLERAPAGTAIVDLLHSVPSFHPRAGAHLLAALQARFPAGTVFFAVIDPGVATDLARPTPDLGKLEQTRQLQVRLGPDDLSELIYIDHYGNALTGLRARNVPQSASITWGQCRARYARTFADAPAGNVFWYENSVGLVELAANRASAAQLLGIGVGDPVRVV